MDETRNVLVNIKTSFSSAGAQQAKNFAKSFAAELNSAVKSAFSGGGLDLGQSTTQAKAQVASLGKDISKTLTDAGSKINLSSAIRQQTRDIVQMLRAQIEAQRQARQEDRLAENDRARISVAQKKIAAEKRAAAAEEKKIAREAAAELKKQEAGLKGISASWGRYRGVVGTVVSALNQFRSAGSGVAAGLRNIHSSISNVTSKFNLFNTIFGRVTVGMLTWQAWRSVVGGFQAITDTIIRSNAVMQTSKSTFAALAGGSSVAASKFIEILRQFSITSGAAFDELLEGARRLPSKIGENYQAFERLVKVAVTLSRIDPQQGLSGAFFAISNALEGGAQGLRSLIQRFEIGTVKEFNDALAETGDLVSALEELLKRQGIDSDLFIESTEDNYDVVVAGLKGMFTEFVRLSTAPAFSQITEWLVSLRNYLRDNQVAVQALATAIGQRLLNGLKMLAAYISEVFLAGKELSAGNIFEAIQNSINSLVDFLHRAINQILEFITALAWAFSQALGFMRDTEKTASGQSSLSGQAKATADAGKELKETSDEIGESVQEAADNVERLPTVVEKFTRSVRDVTSSLLSLREGGKETINRFVSGLLEGLSGDDLKAVHDSILDTVIDLEGQELAQEKSIKKIEEWVDKAAEEVDAAKKRLQLFDLATADVPERYTRARRRQLELEVLKAEEERDARKASLEAAKAQLEATKEYLAAQREVLSIIEQIAESEKSGQVDRGFTEPTLGTEGFQEQVESLVGLMDEKILPTIEKIKSLFSDLGEFIRGFVGADPAGEITEMYQAGQLFGESISGIGESLKNMIDWVRQIFDTAGSKWESLPDGLKAALLVALGVMATPLSNVLLLTLNLGISGTKGAIWLITALAGAGAVAGLVVAIAAASVLVYMLWDDQVAYDWVSGKTAKQVEIIIFAKLGDALQKLIDFLNAPIELDISAKVQELTGDMESGSSPWNLTFLDNPFTNAVSELAKEATTAVIDYFSDDTTISQALYDWAYKPMVSVWSSIRDELVGNSIIPDMNSDILREMNSLGVAIVSPLESIKTTMLTYSSEIRAQWSADFEAMSMAAQRAMELHDQAQAASKDTRETAAKATGGAPASVNASIKLNAKETNRLMREGVYEGMAEVFS